MSTAQLVKNADTQTQSATAISSEQSQKLIQTMLTMSFGCVAFLRGLFPDEYFADQRFVPSKFEPGYKQDEAQINKESIRVKTLLRGRSSQVDLFLDWLEKGATDAIKKGYLRSLSLGLFLDKNHPENLHEVYTFFFDYHDSDVSIDINDDKESITLLRSRKVLQQLMKRFIIITQSLEPLPEEKYMSMRIFFNEDCPAEYQPPLFADASNGPNATVKSQENIESYSAGNFSTGHHDIQLNILAAPSILSPDATYSREIDPFAIPTKKRKRRFRSATTPLPPETPNNDTPSQTTNMLRSYIESSKAEIDPTQALSAIKCECGSVANLQDCPNVECAVCGMFVHSFCYGIDRLKSKSKINCFSCRSKSLAGIKLHNNLGLLLNTRKMFRLISKFGIPSTLSELHQWMGFEDGSNVSSTTDSLSYSIISGYILLTNEPIVKKNNEKLRSGSFSCYIDLEGVLSTDFQTVEPGEYGLTFVPGMRGTADVQYRAIANKFRNLLFKDTIGKCLAIDGILDLITTHDTDYFEKEDIIDSSSIGGSPAKVEEHFSQLNLHSSQMSSELNIESSVNVSKKRNNRAILEDIDCDTIDTSHEFYTSQPVITEPRYKKRKVGVSAVL